MNEIKVTKIYYSKDISTKKYVQKTYDNHKIETTFVDYINKYIICFSTQIGCNLGCKFCYNGIKHNYIRNLTSQEICDQIENVLEEAKPKNDKIILFSAMGIGEPLLNYNNLINSFLYLNKKYPNSKFALATTGINLQNIMKLGNDLKDIKEFKLTISLHCANQDKRNDLMPIKVDNKSLIETVKKYQELYYRKVEWNILLFQDINDSEVDAKELYELLGKNQYIKINKYNKIPTTNLKESSQVDLFISILKNYGMQVEYYETNGDDINAACGQMISK